MTNISRSSNLNKFVVANVRKCRDCKVGILIAKRPRAEFRDHHDGTHFHYRSTELPSGWSKTSDFNYTLRYLLIVAICLVIEWHSTCLIE